MKIDQYCQRQRCTCKHVELEQYLVCFRVARVCRRQLGFLVVYVDAYACPIANTYPSVPEIFAERGATRPKFSNYFTYTGHILNIESAVQNLKVETKRMFRRDHDIPARFTPCVVVQVSTGGTYPGLSVTSPLTPAVEASYLRLEILLPLATSAATMAALKVEFFGSVIADLQITQDRTTIVSLLLHLFFRAHPIHTTGPV